MRQVEVGRVAGARPTRNLVLLLGVLVLALVPEASGAGSPLPWPEVLDARVQALERESRGELSLYVRDVTLGEEYGYRENEVTYLSSTIKLVVALEVLRQVDAGMLSLSDERVFGPEDVRDGVGPLRRSARGRRFTVEELLELMLVRSDNAAADLLIGLVGTESLDAHLARRGVRFGPLMALLDERLQLYGLLDARGAQLAPLQIHELGRHDALGPRARELSRMVGRSPPWAGRDLAAAFDAFYATEVNSASMREMGRLLEQVARCDGLARQSCERLHSLMKACRTGSRRIRAGLPPGAVWAHKTGTQHRRACDVGVLYVRAGQPVVVAACMRSFTRVVEADAVFARLGRAIWESLEAPGGATGSAG